MLLKTALLGTDRTNITEDIRKEFIEKGIVLSDEPEKALLQAIAFRAQWMKAAFLPLKIDDSEVIEVAEDEGENAVYCSEKAATILSRCLGHERRKELLPILFKLLERDMKLVPPALLPRLFEEAGKGKFDKKILRSIVGKRGLWLAAQNEEWSGFFYTPTIKDWEEGNTAQRYDALKYIRETNPLYALEMLEEVWDNESTQNKERFIELLAINPSEQDEDLLLKALKDTRKDIRKPAAAMLSALPDSSFGKDVLKMLKQYLQFSSKLLGGKRMEITLPETCTAEMQELGVQPKEKWVRCGEKSAWLGQLMALLPLHYWSTEFGFAAPDALLKVAEKSEHAAAILAALAQAAVNQKNHVWISAITAHILHNDTQKHWMELSVKSVFLALNDKDFNKLAFQTVKELGKNLTDTHPVMQLLQQFGRTWTAELSEKLIAIIKEIILRDNYVYHWGLKPLLYRTALSAPISSYETLTTGFPTGAASWRSWQLDVDEFVLVLGMRKDFEL